MPDIRFARQQDAPFFDATIFYVTAETEAGNLSSTTVSGGQEARGMNMAHAMECVQEGDLFYRCWIPQDVQQVRAVLVFLHGAGEHSGHYAYLAPVCLQHQMVYVTPDLRGFGQSGGQRGHIQRFEQYLHDLHFLIQRMHQRFPDQPLFLAGHSLGALIVIRYVQQYDVPIRGCIVSAPAFGVPFRFSALLIKLLEVTALFSPAFSINAAWLAKYVKLSWLRHVFPDPERLRRDPLTTCHYTAGWLKELLHNGAAALTNALHFSVPTLYIYFEQDPIVNVTFIRQFYEAMRSDHKTCIVLPECGHSCWYHPKKGHIIQQMMQWIVALTP